LNDLIQASFKDCRNNTQIAARAREPPSGNGADLQTAEGSGCKEQRMPQGDLFEALVVLGSGLGKSRAWHLARTRWQTAVVARRALDCHIPTSPACPTRKRSGSKEWPLRAVW